MSRTKNSKCHYSYYLDRFNVARGVIQGDIISSILFILALDQLVQTYDTHDTDYKCSELLTIRILGYADDAVSIEPRVDDMTCRLTTLADASWREADMKVRMDKTFSHHACRCATTTVTTEEAIEVQAKFKHTSDFCDRRFQTMTTMHQHRQSCV